MVNDYETDEQVLKRLRKEIFIAGYKGGMAHLASCYSCLEIIYTLYCKNVLSFNVSNPKWEKRDRFILSKGHGGLALYAVFSEMGIISKEEFNSYLLPDSKIGGEPFTRDCEWIEATTGSLGHGLSQAVGIAIALKQNHSDSRVIVLLGDGECQEGTVWEAAMSGAAFHLDNLIAIMDCNGIQKTGFVKDTIGEVKWNEKWEAFGWYVEKIDGHDIDQIKRVLIEKKCLGMPKMIIANTVKGKGVSIMENNPKWHFKLPGEKELEIFKSELEIENIELE